MSVTNVLDDFTRSISNDWGNATSGDTWTVTPALATRFSVNGNAGLVSLNVVNTRHFSTVPASGDLIVKVDFKIPATATGSSIACSLVARYQDDNNMYLVQVGHDASGTMDIQILKRVAGTFTSLGDALNNRPYTPNTWYTLKFVLSGNSLTCKLWLTSDPEPGSHLLSTTDTTFKTGSAGTHSNLFTGNTNTLPVVVQYDNFSAVALTSPPDSVYAGPDFDAPRLGVRIFNNWGRAIDTWITGVVEDFEFRHVIPGGCASAVIVLHHDGDREDDYNELAQLYNGVQIVDIRSLNILWEGRVESPHRNRENNTWELGCLGTMAFATDIERPVFYIENRISTFSVGGFGGALFDTTIDEDLQELRFATRGTATWVANHMRPAAIWQKAEACSVRIGRFDITYGGEATDVDWRTGVDVLNNYSVAEQLNVDLRGWSLADARLVNKVGTDFTMTDASRLVFAIDVGPGSAVASDGTFGYIKLPMIQVQRVNETGATLSTAASYPNDYLLVSDVVKDVVGRFLINGWDTGVINNPYAGKVGSENIYIDTSSVSRITRLTYYDGATAAQILTDMMQAQPEAYWALWESRYKAKGPRDPNKWGRARFEWATWPAGVGYVATGIDGLEEQPDGSSQFNFLFMPYQYNNELTTTQVQRYWDTNKEHQAFTDARLVRSKIIPWEESGDTGTAFTKGKTVWELAQRKLNTGTVTIRRPIFFFDKGDNSYTGASRMVEPYEIRPGKLIRLRDMRPMARINASGIGSNPSPTEHDGCTFRLVATTYRSADNSCVAELDQPESWNTSTQLLKGGIQSDNFVVKGT